MCERYVYCATAAKHDGTDWGLAQSQKWGNGTIRDVDDWTTERTERETREEKTKRTAVGEKGEAEEEEASQVNYEKRGKEGWLDGQGGKWMDGEREREGAGRWASDWIDEYGSDWNGIADPLTLPLLVCQSVFSHSLIQDHDHTALPWPCKDCKV
ncbi:hypothetical protein LZ31DRAFT_206160 [Colletotrichum somersetense]|nr:hypothetical protein LZ31DRAFT_206160 [Colletotrichum somersetense]